MKIFNVTNSPIWQGVISVFQDKMQRYTEIAYDFLSEDAQKTFKSHCIKIDAQYQKTKDNFFEATQSVEDLMLNNVNNYRVFQFYNEETKEQKHFLAITEKRIVNEGFLSHAENIVTDFFDMDNFIQYQCYGKTEISKSSVDREKALKTFFKLVA